MALLELFSSQHRANSDSELTKQFKRLYDAKEGSFDREIAEVISSLVAADPKEHGHFVDDAINLLDSCVSYVGDGQLANSVLKQVLRYHKCAFGHVRLNVCKIVHKISLSLPKEISEATLQDICDAMVVRSKDSQAKVRAEAVKLLSIMQASNDPEDIVTICLLDCLVDDVSDVRSESARRIVPSPVTLESLLQRAFDTNVSVRVDILQNLAKYPCQRLKIKQRRALVMSALFFTDETASIFSQHVLPAWLNEYNSDIVKLVEALHLSYTPEGVEETEILCHKLLEQYFSTETFQTAVSHLKLDENNVLVEEEVSWCRAFYWNEFLQFLKDSDKSEDISPNVMGLCKLVEIFKTKMSEITEKWVMARFVAVVRKLLQILSSCDLSDEASRQMVVKTCEDLLETTTMSSAEVLDFTIKTLHACFNDEGEFVDTIIDVIQGLSYPKNKEYEKTEAEKCQRIQALNALKHELKGAVEAQEFLMASKLKDQIEECSIALREIDLPKDEAMDEEELLTDEDVIKSMNIALLAAKHLKARESFALKTCLSSFAQKYLLHDNEQIRVLSFKSAGAALTLMEPAKNEDVQFFFTPIVLSYLTDVHSVTDDLLLAVTESLLDAFVLYNNRLFESSVAKFSFSLDQFIQFLITIMDNEDDKSEEVAVRGMVRMLDLNLVQSKLILARLFIKWLNPGTRSLIVNIIGHFLREAESMPSFWDQMVDAVFIILDEYFRAPAGSTLKLIDRSVLLDVLSTKACVEHPQFGHMHTELTMRVLDHIQQQPHHPKSELYCRFLLCLDKANCTDDVKLRTTLEMALEQSNGYNNIYSQVYKKFTV